jgi:murein L,D-transpeptidase YafK
MASTRFLLLSATLLLLAPAADAKAVGARTTRWPRTVLAKRSALPAIFRSVGLDYPAVHAVIRVLKRERQLELWASGDRKRYRLVKRYAVCAASGVLGPKRRLGDEQVPEGFYSVTSFNPWSRYHSALVLDYPNRADRIQAGAHDPGNSILIHGKCVSIGCVALEDDDVAELFLAAHDAYRRGRRPIAVQIFPARLDAQGMARLRREHATRPALLEFWSRLQPAFEQLEREGTLTRIRIDRRGRYLLLPRATIADER